MTAAQFREARAKLGLTIRQMAELLDVSPTHIHRLEREADRSTSRQVTHKQAAIIHFALAATYRMLLEP